MRPVRWVLAFPMLAIACSGGTRTHGTLPPDPETHSQLAEEDAYVPAYGKPDLQRALIAERGIEATQERVVGELEAKPDRDAPTEDRLRVATADLAVRRRFIQ